jgi:pilus assembly protein Flp/PilA
MLVALKRFAKDKSGATMIEYGLLAALVAIAAITALNFLGTEVEDTFNQIGSELESAQS